MGERDDEARHYERERILYMLRTERHRLDVAAVAGTEDARLMGVQHAISIIEHDGPKPGGGTWPPSDLGTREEAEANAADFERSRRALASWDARQRRAMSVDTAEGADLDAIGALYGVTRSIRVIADDEFRAMIKESQRRAPGV